MAIGSIVTFVPFASHRLDKVKSERVRKNISPIRHALFLIPDASGTLVCLVLHWYPTVTPTIGISSQLVGPTCWPLLAAVCSVGERRVLRLRLRLISQGTRQVSEDYAEISGFEVPKYGREGN